MRVLSSMSGLLVVLSIIIMIHCAIVNKHVRDVEISNGLASATDYAMDRMQQMCREKDLSGSNKKNAVNDIISIFCQALHEMIGSDGEVRVLVTGANLETGTFDFIVEETYQYGFHGRTGLARCERAVCYLP